MAADLEANLAAYLRFASEKPRDESLFWSWEWLRDLCAHHPGQAWDALLWLCERAPDDDALETIGGGHLQDFLWQHPQYAQEFLERATIDEKFYRAARWCELDDEDVGEAAADAFDKALAASRFNGPGAPYAV
jgi:hypothetical protein